MSRWLFSPTELLSWARHCRKGTGTQGYRVTWAPRGPSGFQERALPPLSAPAVSGNSSVALGMVSPEGTLSCLSSYPGLPRELGSRSLLLLLLPLPSIQE